MNYDTAGKEIPELKERCNCGSTGGCEKCNPFIGSFIQSGANDILKEIGPISKEDYDYYDNLVELTREKLREDNEKMRLRNHL